MKNTLYYILRLTMVIVIAAALTGCQKPGSEVLADGGSEGQSAETGSEVSQNTEAEPASLKIGVMPAVDSAPIFLAAKKGYFEDLGLSVDVQVYTNAMNRQSALQSGELDGAMTDMIALVNNVQNGFDIKVTTSTDGAFPFLVKGDLKEGGPVKVGMMEVSVVNYLSDRTLENRYDVEKIYINEIPARMEMIGKGDLDMAVIPEPMASMGELNGLTKVLIENPDDFSPDVMVFTGTAINEKADALKRFHEAYNKAVTEIQADDSEARAVLVETLKLKPKITDKILMPQYHLARVPDEAYVSTIMAWNERVLGKKIDLNYEDLIERAFVE
ncbi:ABC transporter substrate-binding protein [Acidaminobacter hydrogenoformans]|uniref:NitT/TauT family transport system substrate-binding protein n=1 Tax=Acidaminobacter hydrogenoformans DSM 2784 TaxID=1120920 RepID=A0A1G5RU24_9FIRM|nr:ABC transporter substrate-binding protein [Acidaminobacter hydrogenoformans]SCZ77358.1 NitT/TauT family transport system substrate-binding protein [Acidaminobacter hydrogenoformans DSM 2784]